MILTQMKDILYYYDLFKRRMQFCRRKVLKGGVLMCLRVQEQSRNELNDAKQVPYQLRQVVIALPTFRG